MKTLGAYILIHNEESLLKGCVDLILPYVDELLLVNHGCTDGSVDVIEKYAILYSPFKVRVHTIEYKEPVDMGAVRTECYRLMESDWILAVDADEYYCPETMQKIREFVENPGDAISARVKYHNLAWRSGYRQANFDHAPDRLYKREVIDRCEGVLPLDMQYVKSEYLLAPNKKSGAIGVLEYDNEEDKSFEHPRQPILDVYYYHLARTRGYNFEFNKNVKYQKFMHPDWSEEQCKDLARKNQWVSSLYDIEPIQVPDYVPTLTIPKPKVSAIITNYNYGEYVGKAIESVLSQTYPVFECIVVDDCSTDNSRIVVDKYESEGKVKFLRQPKNQGVVNARNWGISQATGDYYFCLDADDFIEPTFVEECLKEMKGDVQITYPNYKVFGEAEYECDYGEFTSAMLKEFQPIPSCCALVDMHVFYQLGGYDTSDWWEDWGYWLRADKKGFKFKRVNKFLFNYRRHNGSRIDLLDAQKEQKLKEFKQKHGI